MYEEHYFTHYRLASGEVEYAASEELQAFMKQVARQIVSEYHPTTVLDCGCATGHLVAALRDLGVEAYGIDISSYAISKVRADIRPYCCVHSVEDRELPGGMPCKFDLAVCIEVLEHLPSGTAAGVISNLCGWSDTVLFSSTDEESDDPTHLNVRQREYWASLFARDGFYHDLDARPAYVAEWACFFDSHRAIPEQVELYEKHLRIAQKRVLEEENENARLLHKLDVLTAQQSSQKKELESYQAERQVLQKHQERLEKDNKRLRQETMTSRQELNKLHAIEREYMSILSSRLWRFTKPARTAGIMWKKALHLIKKTIQTWRTEGFREVLYKVKNYKFAMHRSGAISGTVIDYNTYMRMHFPTEKELDYQRNTKFEKAITFSILVPLYNTPEPFLREMIESVVAQTYPKWELCLADGSDAEHGGVGRIALEYAAKDSRIKYKKLEKNEGIAENTNASLDMSTGDYIALFDHDDLLHPSALYKNMMAIERENADFLYSDEMTFQGTIQNCVLIHFKPDFSPETLCGHNYICHLTVYSRGLFEKVGYFSHEYNGSQDYDMILRLTEQAEKIVHIPEVLYFWRSHPASVASNISAKTYCLTAAKKAIGDHLERIGLQGKVLDSTFVSTYRVKYELEDTPLVSIIIPNKDLVNELDTCLSSIYNISTYPNFEVIVVENNSTQKETFEFYDKRQKMYQNLRVVTWEGQGFNYPSINNYGVSQAKGEYLLLLNNDIEVISPDWIESMLMFAQRSEVGAVGAKLYYPDGTVQHGGVIVGPGGVAAHAFLGWGHDDPGYSHRLCIAQNLSCVTAACLLTKRTVWEQVGGLDEAFAVAFNDVDLCMKIRAAGYQVIFTPFAELYHHESKSRGYEDTPEKVERFTGEVERFRKKWRKELEDGDPYYNPNLTLDNTDFNVSAESRI